VNDGLGLSFEFQLNKWPLTECSYARGILENNRIVLHLVYDIFVLTKK